MQAKLLVIDIQSSLLCAWKKGLSARYTVIEAVGGVEAVRKIRAESIDLVIANISQRSINGVEAVGRIRSSFDRIPIIVLHDPKDVLDLKQAKAYSVNAVFSLPVDYQKLVAEIERLLPADRNTDRAEIRRDDAVTGPGSSSHDRNGGLRPGIHAEGDADVDVEKRYYDGLSFISGNNLQEAIDVFESLLKITRIKKESWRRYIDEALFQLGQCYAALGHFEKSNACYKAFIAKAPHNSSYKSALLYLGKNYIALKDHAKAASFLKQVISTPPFDAYGSQARKLLKTIEPSK